MKLSKDLEGKVDEFCEIAGSLMPPSVDKAKFPGCLAEFCAIACLCEPMVIGTKFQAAVFRKAYKEDESGGNNPEGADKKISGNTSFKKAVGSSKTTNNKGKGSSGNSCRKMDDPAGQCFLGSKKEREDSRKHTEKKKIKRAKPDN